MKDIFNEIIDAIVEILPWELTLNIILVGVFIIICMV